VVVYTKRTGAVLDHMLWLQARWVICKPVAVPLTRCGSVATAMCNSDSSGMAYSVIQRPHRSSGFEIEGGTHFVWEICDFSRSSTMPSAPWNQTFGLTPAWVSCHVSFVNIYMLAVWLTTKVKRAKVLDAALGDSSSFEYFEASISLE